MTAAGYSAATITFSHPCISLPTSLHKFWIDWWPRSFCLHCSVRVSIHGHQILNHFGGATHSLTSIPRPDHMRSCARFSETCPPGLHGLAVALQDCEACCVCPDSKDTRAQVALFLAEALKLRFTLHNPVKSWWHAVSVGRNVELRRKHRQVMLSRNGTDWDEMTIN